MRIVLVLLLFTFSCGKKEKTPEGSPRGCTVSQLANSAKISCPDGSIATIDNGDAGTAGSSCSVERLDNGSKIQCTDGTYALVMDGSSCSVTGTSVGADIHCHNGTSSHINNGLAGQECVLEQLFNGVKITCGQSIAVVYNGTSAYSVVDIIDVCGDDPGEFDEVILKLQNGKLMAHYSHGNDQFLTILESDKTYITTDNSSCPFYVDSNNNVTW